MSVHKLLLPEGIDFAAYFRNAEPKVKVLPATAFAAEVLADLRPDTSKPMPVLPWEYAGKKFQFRPGEVTVWAGVNGQGKSLLTGLVMTSLCAQGQKVGIASFEMRPRKTLGRMLRQAGRTAVPTTQYAQAFIDWLGGRLWLYDHQGQVKQDVLYGVVKYMAVDLGIKHVLIDSLMKCVAGEDDYNAQKEFVNTLCRLALDLDIHIHLVHHIRKLGDEFAVANKFDIKGSGSITDQVDNVLIVWRNRKKERDNEDGGLIGDPNIPDAMLICDKQRNGEWEGKIKLWVCRATWQFVDNADRRLMDLQLAPITK